MERVQLQLQWTAEARGQARVQAREQLWELGLLGSGGALVAVWGSPDWVKPGQEVLVELLLLLQLAERQQLDCCCHFLKRMVHWQPAVDGHEL